MQIFPSCILVGHTVYVCSGRVRVEGNIGVATWYGMSYSLMGWLAWEYRSGCFV